MTSPLIKILLSLAGFSIVYAYVCDIRMSRKARHLAEWIQKERPDLWFQLNFVARNWNGGFPGLKILYGRKIVGLPRFEQEYKQIQSVEREFLWGLGIGVVCIILLFLGLKFWDWHW